MINRGKLRRDIEKGLYEAKLGFSISKDGETPDRFGKKEDAFKPVRVSKGYNDFQEGVFNIPEYSFKSKSGHAHEEAGLISFGGHSNELFLLRKKMKR